MQLLVPLLFLAAQIVPSSLDVTTLSLGPPERIAEIDLGKLKGELRRLSWSTDGTQISLMTAEGDQPTDKTHFYVVAVAGGAIAGADREPDWATAYWTYKSDRYAPGLPSIEIGVEQKTENVKVGTGSAGALDRESSGLGADNVNNAANVERAAQGDRAHVVRLSIFGSVIAEFINRRPLPGLTFGWGPPRAAALAFVDADGRLYLLDSARHKRAVSGVKDAILPAWTTDGSRLAYLQKSGRRKYALMAIDVGAPSR